MSYKLGPICAVYGCKNYKQQNGVNKSFFRMPKKVDILKSWIIACKRQDLNDLLKSKNCNYFYNTFRVCSDHFEIKCFRNKNLFSQGLVPGSIPTKNLFDVECPIQTTMNMEISDAVISDVTTIPQEAECPIQRTINENIATSSATKSLQEENKYLQQTVKECKNILRCKTSLLWKYKKRNKVLQKRLCLSTKKLKAITTVVNASKIHTHTKMTTVCSEFIQTQYKLSGRKKKGRRYEICMKELALALFYCSTRSYKFLQHHFCLPSISSLRSWLNNMHVSVGLNDTVLELLKIKSKKLKHEEKTISLVFDEMSLQENLTYDSSADTFHGFQEYGNNESHQFQLCNNAMVIMIKGIYLDFKQVIGYYLSKDALPADVFKDLFFNILEKIFETGFFIKVVVCDLGTNNAKLRRLLSVTVDKPYILFKETKIYFLFDPPHLLKCIRNNLKKYNIRYNNETYSWAHIVNFYNLDCMQIPRMAPRLIKKCITLPPFTTMRVCLAARTLSHSVHVGILTHVTLMKLPADAIYTAKFIKNIDTLFDIFNSNKYKDKQYRKPISVESDHFVKLEELKQFVQSLKVLNIKGVNPPCIKGWVANINALKLLFEDLKTNFKFQHLFTRRLTQDCAENLFSIIRSKNGNNVTPDSVKFRCSLRSIMVNGLLQPSKDSNSEIDASKFLLDKQQMMKTVKLKVPLQCSTTNDQFNESNNNDDICDMAQKNSEIYILGWVCSRLPHVNCRDNLCNLNNDFAIENTQIELKKYTNSSNLLFPNNKAKIISDILNKCFKQFIDIYLKESTNNVRAKLICNCKNSVKKHLENDVCDTCIDLFLNKYFNVLIKAYVNKFNDCKNKLVLKTKNRKLKKISHN